MSWTKLNKAYSNVVTGERVFLALQHWKTKNYTYVDAKKVQEDDCLFRTSDDNSEISYDWTPTHFIRIVPPAQ